MKLGNLDADFRVSPLGREEKFISVNYPLGVRVTTLSLLSVSHDWESLGRLQRSQLILLALSTVCAFCSVYCAVYITKSVGESSESFIELLSESFKSDRELSEPYRELSESFMKEMKEINSSLRESLHNLTGTVAEFYDFFEKEIQEMKASQFKIINLTESFVCS